MKQKLLFGVCGRIGKQTKLGARFVRIIFVLTSLLITFYVGAKLPFPVHDAKRFVILFLFVSVYWYLVLAIGSFWWGIITKPPVKIPEGQFNFIIKSKGRVVIIEPVQKNMEMFAIELVQRSAMGETLHAILSSQRQKWPKAEIEIRAIGMLNNYPAYIWSIRKK